MIPTLEEIYFLLEKEKVPPHIVLHSEKVALISFFLGYFLKQKGAELNLSLLLAGALLHDIKKYQTLLYGGNHALEGYYFLKNLGYERVGKIVLYHIYYKPSHPMSSITEEEIVYYADKRVKHEEIVSLKERFYDLKERYGKDLKDWIRMNYLEEITKLVEKRIFKKIPFGPDKVIELEKIKEVRNVLKKVFESSSSGWRYFFGERSFT